MPSFLTTFVTPYRWRLVLVATTALVGVGCALAQPLAMQRLFTTMDERTPLHPAVLFLIAVTVGEAVFTALQTAVLQRTGSDAVLSIRTLLVSRLLRWPLSRYRQSPRGELVTLLTTDSTRMHAFVTGGVFEVAAALLLTVGALVLMAILSPVLLAVSASAIVVVVLAVALSSRSVRDLSREAQDQTASMGAAFGSGLESIRTIRTAGGTAGAVEKVLVPARAARDAAVALGYRLAVVTPLSQLAAQGAFLAVLAVGGAQVSSGAMRAGDLLAFLLYVVLLLAPLESGLRAIPLIQQSRGSWDRIKEALAAPLEPGARPIEARRPTGPISPPADPQPAALRFAGVHFRYPGAEEALVDVDFAVPVGARCVVVGPSGAGKSTLFDLATRLWEPQEGAVYVGTHDVRELTRDELSSQIAYLEQAAPLLSATLADNLRLGRPEAPESDLLEALSAVGLRHLADTPAGLEVHLGAGGAELSGGEAQRLALARTILSPAPVLLIDEPTSRLDGVSEHQIYTLIRRLAEQRTVVVITHRLHPVLEPDQVVVVQPDGTVTTGPGADDLDPNPDDLLLSPALAAGAPAVPDVDIYEGELRR